MHPPPDHRRDFAVYGSQLLPLTPVVPLLLQPAWIAQSWPRFNRSCLGDEECKASGFTAMMYAEQVWDALARMDWMPDPAWGSQPEPGTFPVSPRRRNPECPLPLAETPHESARGVA